MTLLLLGIFVFIVVGLYCGYIEAKDKKKYLALSVLGLTIPILALFLFWTAFIAFSTKARL